jgi:hypothetical protein
MSDIQGQLSLQAKLLQSIKDEIGGLKRAFTAAEASRDSRFNSALAKLRAEFDTSRIEVIASNVLAVAEVVERNSVRIQAIMGHLGLPDIEFDGDDGGHNAVA